MHASMYNFFVFCLSVRIIHIYWRKGFFLSSFITLHCMVHEDKPMPCSIFHFHHNTHLLSTFIRRIFCSWFDSLWEYCFTLNNLKYLFLLCKLWSTFCMFLSCQFMHPLNERHRHVLHSTTHLFWGHNKIHSAEQHLMHWRPLYSKNPVMLSTNVKLDLLCSSSHLFMNKDYFFYINNKCLSWDIGLLQEFVQAQPT